jgi:hypothetical protein
MNKLTDLIKNFTKHDDWQNVVKENFERKSGTYTYVSITDIEVKSEKNVFHYPTKIVFESGYVKSQKNIVKQEKTTVNNRQIKITERKKIIPLGFYQRDKKYSGDIFQIINDILDNANIQSSSFSNELLTPKENPLYSVDSKQKWASYLLVIQKEMKLYENISSTEEFSFLNDILDEYGIHFSFEKQLKDFALIIFPMPYLRVVENKLRRNESGESVFLVIEFNQLPLFYTSQIKIEIDGVIKNLKNEIIYKKTEVIKFAKAKYQVVELFPDQKSEIGFTDFSIKINGTLVDKFSGYYIRDIKLDIKAI